MTRNTTKKLIRSKVRLRRRQAGDARTLNPVGLRPEPVEGPSTSSGRTPTDTRAPVCRWVRGGGSRGSPPLLDTRAPVCRWVRGGGSRGSPPLLDTRAPVCRWVRGGGSRGSPPLLDTRAPVCRCVRGGGSRGSPPLLDTSRDLDLLDRVVLGDLVGDRLLALGQLLDAGAALQEGVPEH